MPFTSRGAGAAPCRYRHRPMTPPLRRFLGAGLGLLIVAAAATTSLLVAYRSSEPILATPALGGCFALTAADGSVVTDRSYPGKWLLVYFGYTYCPDACPTALSNIAGALAKLGPTADKLQVLFITVDPGRDTPKVMGDYVRNFDPADRRAQRLGAADHRRGEGLQGLCLASYR